MITIYKYILDPEEHYYQILQPAKVLSVESQDDKIVLYALVDTEKREEEVYIDIVMAGEIFLSLEGVEFVNTVLLFGGHLVYHVFVDKRHSGRWLPDGGL